MHASLLVYSAVALATFAAATPDRMRHQLFVFGKTDGALLVLEALSLDPYDAIRAASELRQKIIDNSSLIYQEMQSLGDPAYLYGDKNAPLPFLAHLLATSWLNYEGRPSLLCCASDEPRFKENETGQTVFDITDPDDVEYCFLSGDTPYDPIEAPMDVQVYLATYGDPGRGLTSYEVERPNDAIQSLMEASVVQRGTLRRLWSQRSFNHERNTYGADRADTLTRTAFERQLRMIITSGDEDDARSFADSIYDLAPDAFFGKTTVALLRDQTSILDEWIPFLIAAITHSDEGEPEELDLSGLHLTSQQVLTVLEGFPDVKRVDLSHNPEVEHWAIDELIESRLGTSPELERIVLFNCMGLGEDAEPFVDSDTEVISSQASWAALLEWAPYWEGDCFSLNRYGGEWTSD